jgi:Leucine-rich repeat (LRR) protein
MVIKVVYINFDGDEERVITVQNLKIYNNFIRNREEKNPEYVILKLNFFNNNLKSLPKLPEGLEKLDCSGNKLKSLPKLPNSLKDLDCWNNNLTSLPELPEGLEKLDCSRNNLTRLPDNLTQLRNLKNIYYYDNEIELTIQQINFINRLRQRQRQEQIYKNNKTFYDYSQNVHDSHIQKQLLNNINILMNDK